MIMGGTVYAGGALMGYISDEMRPTFVTDVTILKLAFVAKQYLVGDFPQGIIVTILCGPRPSIVP